MILFLGIPLIQGCSNSLVNQPVIPDKLGNHNLPGESINASTPDYIIRAGDELDIKFFYNHDLNETVTVRPDGRISLQLVHDVPAAGLSPGELTKILTKKFSSHIKDPEISVIVKAYESRRIYVDGQVKNPGMVSMGGYMDLLQAIASAGGMIDSAMESQVLVIRRNGLKKPFIIAVDVEKIRSGEDPSQNIILKPYDIVFVPKSRIAQVNTWVDLYLRKNIPFDFSAGVYRSLD
jgi:protein involved in polysaccharide export with SLBB domain